MLWLPPTLMAAAAGGVETLLTRTTETIIHDFNQLGGGAMTKLFDGMTSQAWGGGTTLPYKSGSFCNVGLTFLTPLRMSKFVVYGSNDDGFILSANPSTTIDIYGKAGTVPSTDTDGTLLGTLSFTDTANESAGRTITSTDQSTSYDHVWARISTGSSTSITAAEIRIYYLA